MRGERNMFYPLPDKELKVIDMTCVEVSKMMKRRKVMVIAC